MLKKLKRRLRACRLKMGEGVYKLRYQTTKMYLSQNYNEKNNFIVRFPSTSYQTHLLMTSQNSIHHITDITYTSEIFPTYI